MDTKRSGVSRSASSIIVLGGLLAGALELAACGGLPPEVGDEQSPLGQGTIVGDTLVGGVGGVRRSGSPLQQALGANGHHIMFLNFEGVTLAPNYDDAVHNQSSIAASVGHTIVVPRFDSTAYSTTKARDQVIADIVARTHYYFQDFNVDVVSTRPTSGNYVMVAIGGLPDLIGMPCDQNGCVEGLAPLDCANDSRGGIVYNPGDDVEVVFGFSDTARMFPGTYASKVDTIVTTNAQETAHAYGLGHTSNQNDVMYPSVTNSTTGFLDLAMTYADTQNCARGRGTQNSHQVMIDTLGKSGTVADTTPPTVTINDPKQGQSVARQFAINVTAADNIAVDHIDVTIQGQGALAGLKGQMTFSGSTASWPQTVTADGTVSIAAVAYDTVGNRSQTASVSAAVKTGTVKGFGSPCGASSECATGLCSGGVCTQTCGMCPVGFACNSGVCGKPVVMAMPGEIGAACTDGTMCHSGTCATQGAHQYCTGMCDPTMSICPAGMICANQGANAATDSVCVFPSGSGSSSCSIAGLGARTDGSGLALLALLVGIVPLLRRRRRAQ